MIFITEHLMERLFKLERIIALLNSLSGRRTEKTEAVSTRIQCTSARSNREAQTLVEEELTELNDVLRDRLNVLKAARIDQALIGRFSRTVREISAAGRSRFGRPTCSR
jgi:hypothetical protein